MFSSSPYMTSTENPLLTIAPQTAQLFAQCMHEKLPRGDEIPSEVRTWSNFVGGKAL